MPLLALLGGCDAEILAIYVGEPLTAEQSAALDDAAGLIGHEIVMAKGRYGAVHVRWLSGDLRTEGWEGEDLPVTGETEMGQRGCRRKLSTIAAGQPLAHEIGHVFGLRHEQAPDDVMTQVATDDRDHFAEQDALTRRVNRFSDCWVH